MAQIADLGTILVTPPIAIYRARPIASIDSVHGSPGPITAPPAASPESTATISPQGQLLSNLQTLQATQPAQFQAALGRAASGLQEAAQQAGPATPQGQQLAKSAAKVQQVVATGDTAILQPRPPAGTVAKLFSSGQGGNEDVLSLLSTPVPPATSRSATTLSLANPFGSPASSDNGLAAILNRVVQSLHKATAGASS